MLKKFNGSCKINKAGAMLSVIVGSLEFSDYYKNPRFVRGFYSFLLLGLI